MKMLTQPNGLCNDWIFSQIYECPECDYKTSRKQSMYKHALKHKPLAEVGITCEHCGKQFRDER